MARTSAPLAFLSALSLACAAPSRIVAQGFAGQSVEIAATFSTQRSLEVNTAQNFWAEGGSVELGANAFHGLGLGATVSGVHTASVGTTGTPLSLVIAAFGPRFRWHDGHAFSPYAEGLLGEANAFRSLFPSPGGAQSDANSLALRVGGGLDVRLTRHLTARAFEAAWLRTQLPNSTGNVQNNLCLGAGFVFRAGR